MDSPTDSRGTDEQVSRKLIALRNVMGFDITVDAETIAAIEAGTRSVTVDDRSTSVRAQCHDDVDRSSMRQRRRPSGYPICPNEVLTALGCRSRIAIIVDQWIALGPARRVRDRNRGGDP